MLNVTKIAYIYDLIQKLINAVKFQISTIYLEWMWIINTAQHRMRFKPEEKTSNLQTPFPILHNTRKRPITITAIIKHNCYILHLRMEE